MRLISNPPPLTEEARKSAVKIQIPVGQKIHRVHVVGHEPMTFQEFARFVHPVPFFVGNERIEPAKVTA